MTCGLLENHPGSPAAPHQGRKCSSHERYDTNGYSPTYGPVKTLAVRVSEDLRAQLDIIAQLNDRSVTEEIRLAIEGWIEKSKSDPAVLQRAESVRAEIA
jgi:uncharacterized membrane-anchored protein YjiN (DUF445 family)